MANENQKAVAVAEEPKIYGSMDDIEKADDGIEYALVDGFRPGEKFRIGSLTAGDFIEWSEANEGEAKRTAGLRLICRSLVDAQGNRFANDDKNIAKFRARKHKDTERIVREILKLNGINVKAQENAKND